MAKKKNPVTPDDTTNVDPADTTQSENTDSMPDDSVDPGAGDDTPPSPPEPEPEPVIEAPAVERPEPLWLNYEVEAASLSPGTEYYAHWQHDPRNTDQQRHVEQIAVDLASGAIQRRGLPASYWNSVVGNPDAVPPVYRRGERGESDMFVR
jgi:hypothetical protein